MADRSFRDVHGVVAVALLWCAPIVLMGLTSETCPLPELCISITLRCAFATVHLSTKHLPGAMVLLG